MKQLLILRHAKSSWKDSTLDDHDRPLNGRGKRDAPRIGKLLRSQGIVPDVILSSTALRARTTAQEVARASGFGGELLLARELYLAGPRGYLEILRQLDGACGTAMVVAHNPGLEELLTRLTGVEEALPTAALARVRLDLADWSALGPRTRGELAGLWRPRELPADP